MKNVKIFSFNKIISKRNIHQLVSKFSHLYGLQINFLEINIVTSNIVLELNRNYLNHNHRTDILTFNYSENKSEIEGEIYISFEDAQANSKRFSCSLDDELKRLIVHGLLHLLGFQDNNTKQKKEMRIKEDYLLKLSEKITIIK
jgi:rRNA maturation RNase YbeY